jgi:hypothetical protein
MQLLCLTCRQRAGEHSQVQLLGVKWLLRMQRERPQSHGRDWFRKSRGVACAALACAIVTLSEL